MKTLFFILALGGMAVVGCSSKAILDEDDVKIIRDEPSGDCENLGTITGRTMYAKQTREDAIKDLKKDAAAKGANYVRFAQASGSGTVVTGTGYKCK